MIVIVIILWHIRDIHNLDVTDTLTDCVTLIPMNCIYNNYVTHVIFLRLRLCTVTALFSNTNAVKYANQQNKLIMIYIKELRMNAIFAAVDKSMAQSSFIGKMSKEPVLDHTVIELNMQLF